MAVPEDYSVERARESFNRLVDTYNLDDRQVAYLRIADVRTEADFYSLLTSSPELEERGIFATRDLTARLTQTEGAMRIMSSAREKMDEDSFAFGAEAPERAEFKSGDRVEQFTETTLALASGDAEGPLANEEPVFAQVCEPWPVRNQGRRGTCVAFTAIALYELYRCRESETAEELSEQFLYWAIKHHGLDGIPNREGTWFRYAAEALETYGTCLETDWAYDPTPKRDLSHNPPPSGASASAATLKFPTSQEIDLTGRSNRAKILLSMLRQHNGVGIALPVFDSPMGNLSNWTTRIAQTYGVVQAPLPGWAANGGHAVCCTGFMPDPLEPLGGHFIIRNSWNGLFGSLLPEPTYLGPEVGYGQIAASHINDYLWQIMVF